MEIERPTGEIEEYDALNRLVDFNDQAIVDRTIAVHNDTGWGILRCRMAAIVESVADRFDWPVDPTEGGIDFLEAQRRALALSRWRQLTR